MEGNKVTCPVCGGCEYVKECGFYYCKECQTQSQEIREQVYERDQDSAASERGESVAHASSKAKLNKEVGDLTSWEIYNVVLSGQVQELMDLGAPSSLQLTVLQLWTHYLGKLEVAFTSKNYPSMPRLGPGFNTRDAELLYGFKNQKKKKTHNASSRASAVSSVTPSNEWDAVSEKKRIIRKSKKALMAQESLLLASDRSEITAFSQTSMFDESSGIASDTDKSINSHRSRYSVAAKETLQRRKSLKNDNAQIKHCQPHYTHPTKLSRFKLIVILYLGLLYNKSDIHISDLLRWIRECHLSYFHILHLLPPSQLIDSKYIPMYGPNVFVPSYAVFVNTASQLARYLGVVDWPTPSAQSLAKKFVKELNLPAMFITLVERFVVIMPLSFLWRGDDIPNYEARTLAIIIIILKLLLGLDGETEHKISTAASQLNILKRRKKGTRQNQVELFVWSDWVKCIICRDAVVANHHFPTKEALCPDVCGNPQTFMNFRKTWDAKYGEARAKFKYVNNKGIREDVMGVIAETLRKLSHSQQDVSEGVSFPATLTPFSSYTQCVLQASTSGADVTLEEAAVSVISKDFSDADISYLLSPDLCEGIIKKHNTSLKVKFKRSQKSVILEEELGKKRSRSRKKKVTFLVSCSRGMKRKLFTESKKQSLADNKLNEKRRKSAFESGSNSANTSTINGKNVYSSGNKIYMYVPCSQYWVWRGSVSNFTEEEFEEQVATKFPSSFMWILSECALLSEMTRKCIFQEVLLIEDLYEKHYKDLL